MERLIEVARGAGLESMSGWVLADNRGMLALCHKLGFREHTEPGDTTVRVVELDLAAAPAERATGTRGPAPSSA